MLGSWTTLSKKREYTNPFMAIWRHEVIRDNGHRGPYYVLERDTAGRYFSIIIPLTKDLKTVLVGQYRYPVGYYSWEFPMGHAEGKDFLETAKIELREETGIEAATWEKIGSFFTAPGYSSEAAQVFVAKDISFGQKKISETEVLETKTVLISNVKEMIKKGRILDGPTIVAYHYLEIYLGG